MFHVNTYASVTKVSIFKEDLIDWQRQCFRWSSDISVNGNRN